VSHRLIDTAPESIVSVDRNGRIVDFNRKAEQMFNAGPSDLMERPLIDVILTPVAELLEERDEWIKVRARRVDGTEFLAEVALSRIEDLPALHAAWIRERPSNESPAWRAGLFEATEVVGNLGGWEFTPTDETLRWSDNLYRIFGYEPGAITPSPEFVYSLTHPDDRELVERHVEEVAQGRATAPFDYRIVVPSVGIRHLRTRLAIQEDLEGRPWRMIGLVQDITEQRRAEREIAAHLAVSNALAGGRSLKETGPMLLRCLAEAIEFTVGILWVPLDDFLVVRDFWSSRTVEVDFEGATREPHIKAGLGLPGRVWSTAEPIAVSNLAEDPACLGSAAARRAGLRGAVAFPALHRGEVLAVLEFRSPQEALPPERLLQSLSGIGYEIGQFLASRRGELQPPSLTPREREVLQLAALGQSAPRIADDLVVSRATVKTHFENIYEKLEVSDRPSAVAKALRLGLIN
jgi:PAS domain S-box-containing protein